MRVSYVFKLRPLDVLSPPWQFTQRLSSIGRISVAKLTVAAAAAPEEDDELSAVGAAVSAAGLVAAGASVAADPAVGCDAGVLAAGLAQADNTPTTKSRTTNLTFMDFIFCSLS
jgi:hypothetical protein